MAGDVLSVNRQMTHAFACWVAASRDFMDHKPPKICLKVRTENRADSEPTTHSKAGDRVKWKLFQQLLTDIQTVKLCKSLQ